VSGELLLVGMRMFHLLAAAAWVGGALAYAVAGRPAPGTGRRPFGWLVRVCTWVLALSGAALAFDRLTGADAATSYVAVLALKTALALAMFALAGTLAPSALRRARAARAPGPPKGPIWLSRPYLVLECGIAVYALGAVLAVNYAHGLAGR